MQWIVEKSSLAGTIRVPASKSHTIRAFLAATLASGKSVLSNALVEGDGRSALDAAIGLGAAVTVEDSVVTIDGIGGDFSKGSDLLFLGNSGTGTNMFTSAASLGNRPRTFDGDSSLRSRPAKPLLEALRQLGAEYSLYSEKQHLPFTVQGPIHGGAAKVDGLNSQYLSSLLFTTPLLKEDTVITVDNLHEKPYVMITLWWLDRMGIRYSVSEDFTTFTVFGNQRYAPFDLAIPGDFSSATFPAVAAGVTGGVLSIEGIDFSDPQGDKEIFSILEKMGAQVTRSSAGAIVDCSKTKLSGIEIDLNTMPDALPAFAVLGCFAEGETTIVNVRQARIKETDRIAVMCAELRKMGAAITERDDGLVIRKSALTGTLVNGHHDHRVIMALAIAGMNSAGKTTVETAESAAVTYPTFARDFGLLGAQLKIVA